MKKLFKIAGIALLSLIGLLLAIFLLARFVFREQAIDYLTGLEKQQRVELLRRPLRRRHRAVSLHL